MVKKNYLANPKKMHFMSTPENLKYTKDHEWVAIDGNLATIGITHYAQHELGAEDVFGTVEAVKTVSDLFLPVSGTITVVNPALEANPELVNSDPYGEGWMVKMEIDAGADLSRLMDATGYNSLIG